MIRTTQILQQQSRHVLANYSINNCLTRRSYKTLSAVKAHLERWRSEQGDQVKPSYVRGVIKNFRDFNQCSKALEASEWMCEQKVFNIFSEDYAARLQLVETVLGLEEAEKFFESIPENMRDYSVYDNLLRSYTKSEKTLDKAEATFEKMRDLGFLLKPSPFNSMISLYRHLKKKDMVKKLEREMMENDVRFDSHKEISVLSILRSYKRDVMYPVWNYNKKIGKMTDEGYRSRISYLLKLDDVQGAEKLYEEWKPAGPKLDMSIPSLLISRFCAEGKGSKVEELVDSIRKKKIGMLKERSAFLVASEWMCQQRVFNIFPEDYAARLNLVETVLGLEEAEKFFESIPENMKDYSVYDNLLRIYTESEETLYEAEETFEKMRDLGFLSIPSPYNSMISLYRKLKKRDKVKKLQREMMENNVKIDRPIELNVLSIVSDFKRDCLDPLWNKYKKEGKLMDDEYRVRISYLLKMDDVQGADNIYEKWQPTGPKLDMTVPGLLISRFRAEGNESKVEEMVNWIRIKGIVMHLATLTLCLINLGVDMEIESHDSVPGKNLVKVEFKLGTESYTIDSIKGDTVFDQLVSMKEESMKILKDFITKHNVQDDDVPDQILSDEEEGDDDDDDASPVICPVKPKKTKI
ncbi:unnamed protein product [Arabidopsis arenosa]|uniref:Uncharacterized protein n=1 Tax=Arabidopsis arenosa TaxID=38785 RepID=A0A8S1ZI33_ARAAE|nr:unnamed protein product [Arabidopsis arenosa]